MKTHGVAATFGKRLGRAVLAVLALLAVPALGDEGGAGVPQGREYHRHNQYVQWSD